MKKHTTIMLSLYILEEHISHLVLMQQNSSDPVEVLGLEDDSPSSNPLHRA